MDTATKVYLGRIDMVPVSASRPRVSGRGTYYGKRYTAYKAELPWHIKKLGFREADFADKYLSLCVVFGMPIAKSLSKKKRLELGVISGQYCGGHIDVDNLLKGVMDCMFVEDCNVVSATSTKVWHDVGVGYIDIYYTVINKGETYVRV